MLYATFKTQDLCAFYFLVVVFERLWLIVVAFLAVLLFMCMYHALSFYHRPMMYGIAGSLFSVCSFVILGAVLTKMLETFTSYSTVYGPMASFMTLLLSIYIIACIWDSVFTSYWKRQRMSANVN